MTVHLYLLSPLAASSSSGFAFFPASHFLIVFFSTLLEPNVELLPSSRRCCYLISHLLQLTMERLLMAPDFGLGYLPPSDSPLHSSILPPGIQPMAGSLMIFHSESLDRAWERVREDVYYTAGVWDKEKLVLNQFINPPEGALYP